MSRELIDFSDQIDEQVEIDSFVIEVYFDKLLSFFL
jgi:hypothetical protein